MRVLPSKLSIINAAFAKIGVKTVDNLDDRGVARTRRALAIYYIERQAVLEETDWNCARETTTLTPQYQEQYKRTVYAMPNDMLKVIRVGFGELPISRDYEPLHRVEGDNVVFEGQHTENLAVRYISASTPERRFDSLLVDSLVLRLAAELAYAITGSANLGDKMNSKYQNSIAIAKTKNAQEGAEPESDGRAHLGDWFNSRLLGTSFPQELDSLEIPTTNYGKPRGGSLDSVIPGGPTGRSPGSEE